MELISITDFVLEQSESIKSDMIGYGEFIDKVVKYAQFLKQPLKLGMFIPCVDNEPFNYSKHGNTEQFEKAKEKVLFEGWDYCKEWNEIRFNGILISVESFKFMTVESLVYAKPILYKKALKQIRI